MELFTPNTTGRARCASAIYGLTQIVENIITVYKSDTDMARLYGTSQPPVLRIVAQQQDLLT